MNIVLLLIGEDKDILKQVQNQLVKNDWLSIRSWSTDNPEGRIVSPAWFEQNASALAEYEEVDGCYNGTSLFDYTTDGELKRVITLTLARAEKLQKALAKENITHYIVYLSSSLGSIWEKLLKQEKEIKSAVQKLRAISKEFTNPNREAFLYGGNIDLEIEVDGMRVEEICAQIEQFIQKSLNAKRRML